MKTGEDTTVKISEELKAISAKVNIQDFKIAGRLGCGTYGKVQLVKHIKNEKLFALKELSKSRIIRLRQVKHIKSERK
jgi:serine/threonine protein kinase